MAGSQRNVSVRFTAEIQGFKASMEAAAAATQKARQASEDAGRAADKSAEEINAQALAHHEAAKAAGLQYDNTGQLVTMNGKALTSQQAATHGLQTFSQEAYLAGRAAVSAGEDADAAATVAAEAQAAAADAAKEHQSALEELAKVAVIGGGAMVAGVGLSVKAYADFDKQMSSVDAATHETAGNMDLLRQAAIDAGADTAFSAGEAAQGIEELAKAGVSTNDILAGGLNGSLALAAAGSLDVGQAAEIAASALTQFKLSGDKVPHVADLLAAGAGKAQGSVEDLGAALNQSGLVASSTGLTIEETTGALSAFASAGLTGSDAGTSFKTMLMSLNPNSKEAARLMDELGIRAYDAQGKFVGMSEYAGILQNALKDMSDEQRNATLKTLFGSDAVRAANVVYEQGTDGINKWESAVNDAGYAADTAARMQNNLAGDLEKLGGSFDTVLIQSGSGANDVLRGLVGGLEGVVDAVGKVPGPALAAGAGITAVVGGAALLAGGLVAGITRVRETRDAFNTLAPAGSRARGALVSVGKAAGVLAGLVAVTAALAKLAEADYMSKIDTGMGNVNNALADVTSTSPAAANALDNIFKDRDGGDLINTVDGLDSAIKRTFNRDAGQQFNDWGEGLVNGMTGVKGSSQILEGQFKSLDAGLAGLVSSGKRGDAVKAFERIREAARSQGVTVEELVKKFPAYSDALKQAEADAKNAGEGGDKAAAGMKGAGDSAATAKLSAEDLAKALEDVGLAADGSIVDVEKFGQSLFNAGLLSLSASSASIAYQDAIDKMTESVTKNGTTLDINTEAGRANQSAFNGIAQAAIASAEASATETLATQGSAAAQAQLQASLQTSYDDLIRAAGQLGITGDAADTMARKALGIPKEIPIDTWVKDNASATLDGIKGKADNLDGRQVTLEIFEKTWATRYENGTMDVNHISNGPGGRGGLTEWDGGVVGFAGGGKVPGTPPASQFIDNVRAQTQNGTPYSIRSGEWIINEPQSKANDKWLRAVNDGLILDNLFGNRERAAVNAGMFPTSPGYATGGRVGREYTAQSLGYAPTTSASGNVPMQMTGTLTMDSGEVLGVFHGVAVKAAQGVVQAADFQSQFARRGR